jgi:predicted nucleic acid-binding Zn ribbon protein
VPRYDFRCPAGHVTEQTFAMAEVPPCIECPDCPAPDASSMESLEGPEIAYRVYQAPAAIHFHGSGFYQTDVTSRVGRRRRPNPGDDLPVEFDTDAARIADAI